MSDEPPRGAVARIIHNAPNKDEPRGSVRLLADADAIVERQENPLVTKVIKTREKR
jgi:hypothetical protein